MLTLSRVYLRADQPERGPEELEKLARSIRKSTHSISTESFRRHEIETGEVVRAREGSVEIIVIVTTLMVFIRDYDKIKENLRQILEDVRAAGREIRSMIVKRLNVRRDKIEESRVTTGHPGQIKGLRKRVAQRRMSYKDAHEKAVEILKRGSGKVVSKALSRALLEFFKEAASEPKVPPNPKKSPGGAVPARRLLFRRRVRLERRPGEEKVRSST